MAHCRLFKMVGTDYCFSILPSVWLNPTLILYKYIGGLINFKWHILKALIFNHLITLAHKGASTKSEFMRTIQQAVPIKKH